MARRNWVDLSDRYQARLLRGGIDQRAYERGESLSAARGHAQTPEHPLSAGEVVPQRYERWFNERFNSPIKMLTDQGEVWLVGVPMKDRSVISGHWNAVQSYLFNKPMRKARWWKGNTRTALNWFDNRTVRGSILDENGGIRREERHHFMTKLHRSPGAAPNVGDNIDDWTQSDVVSFSDIYQNSAA